MAESEADIIVVGGGTAGLITAGRLAQAKPDLSILVIEAGANYRGNQMVVNPAIYLSHIAPTSTVAKFYKSKPSDYLAGREAIVSTANILGGGSSINFMVYARAQEVDFDDWNTEGWRGKDMIPFLQKIERFQDRDPEIDKSIHGYNGELSISAGGTYVQDSFQKVFFKACEEIGIKKVPDVQDFKTANAVGDHNAIFYSYSSKATAEETLDGLLTGRLTFEKAVEQKAANSCFGKSVTDIPEFNTGFLNHPVDTAIYNGPHSIGHPIFPPGSKADPEIVDAASKAQGYPAPIEYSEADNKVIEQFIRENLTTTWHSMGTYLSICPANVAANTYSTALAIGEKAASIIARELGISAYSTQKRFFPPGELKDASSKGKAGGLLAWQRDPRAIANLLTPVPVPSGAILQLISIVGKAGVEWRGDHQDAETHAQERKSTRSG
ncbi:predicted protein [Histoplasma mississippiense (nom. inval.)]|uniref:predicted protein n=1 Tax=Ajellomyces capsulatus (strain NAm1 / WU24) TaxID=2059318 RepID=UPI000157B2E9|nr:predicted protein [Histoplasma mississippiense (nom. inval.)]EDN02159.1 predicted protein [Histoplasma mississippiense (nom. inval.)]